MFYWILTIILIVILVGLFVLYRYLYPKYDDTFDKLYKESKAKPFHLNRTECMNLLKNTQTKNLGKKIAIVSLSVGKRDFAMLNKKYLEQYCTQYNYDLIYFTETIDKNYNMMWQKILAVNKVLKMKKHDYIVWIDDDILITNFNYKLEDFISLSKKGIIMSKDLWVNSKTAFINAGIFILKNDKITNKFMKETLDGYHNIMGGKFMTNNYYDQSIMVYLYFTKYYKYIDILPHGVLESQEADLSFRKEIAPYLYNWHKGDFCYHPAGIKNRIIYIKNNEKYIIK